MTEKRFEIMVGGMVWDNHVDEDRLLSRDEVVDLLNEQHETITTQKHIIDKQEIRLKEFENVLQRLCDMQNPINAIVCKEIVKKELGVDLE